MAITAGMVKTLRDKTGLPMMECKKALTEADGDQEKAIEILRKMGAGRIQKLATREATEGRIACFVDPETKRAGIIELARRELGLECQVRPIDRSELYVADEVFLCGTGGQVSAVASIDHRPVGDGSIGPLA